MAKMPQRLRATLALSLGSFLYAAAALAQATTVELSNPLGTADVPLIVGRIVQVLTGGAGMLALMMFIYGGFQWLTAAGNPEKIKKGKDIVLWSILGITLMLSSYIVVRYIILGILKGTINP